MPRRKIFHPEPCNHEALYHGLINTGWSVEFALAIARCATMDERTTGWATIAEVIAEEEDKSDAA